MICIWMKLFSKTTAEYNQTIERNTIRNLLDEVTVDHDRVFKVI